jgi:hypothetical protein
LPLLVPLQFSTLWLVAAVVVAVRIQRVLAVGVLGVIVLLPVFRLPLEQHIQLLLVLAVLED